MSKKSPWRYLPSRNSAKRKRKRSVRLRVEPLEDRRLLAVLHNLELPLDTNIDSQVTAADALVVFNEVNSSRTSAQGEAASYRPDVDGNGQVSAIDALLVINYLNGTDTAGQQDVAARSEFASEAATVVISAVPFDAEVGTLEGSFTSTSADALDFLPSAAADLLQVGDQIMLSNLPAGNGFYSITDIVDVPTIPGILNGFRRITLDSPIPATGTGQVVIHKVITQVATNTDFLLGVYAQDLGTPASFGLSSGPFAVFADIHFDASLALETDLDITGEPLPESPTKNFQYNSFVNGKSGTISSDLVDEAGAFRPSGPGLGRQRDHLVFTVDMRTGGTGGTLDLGLSPAGIIEGEDPDDPDFPSGLPAHDVLVNGSNVPVCQEIRLEFLPNDTPPCIGMVQYIGTTLEIIGPTVTTEVSLRNGALTITDISGGDSDDDLQLSYASGTYTLTDLGGLAIETTIPGSTGDGTSTVTFPDTGVTRIVFDTLGGNDSIGLNSVQSSLPGGFSVNGGAGVDTFELRGGIDGGPGDVVVTVSKNIVMHPSSHIVTTSGNIILSANQQASPSPGSFAGIEIDDGIIFSTGSGNIRLDGRGGTSAGDFIAGSGINVHSGGSILSCCTGLITLNGQGGPTGSQNYGVRLTDRGTQIVSAAGLITINARGGGTTTDNPGLRLERSALVFAAGDTSIDIHGIAGGSVGVGAAVFLGGRIIANQGPTTINGTSSGDALAGVAVFRNGIVESDSGPIAIHGTADNTSRGVSIRTAFGLPGKVQSRIGEITIRGNAMGTGSGVEVSGAGSEVTSMGGAIVLESTRSLVIDGSGAVTNTIGDITLRADELDISNASPLQGLGDLKLEPANHDTTIGLGGGAGTLNLDDSELGLLMDGFNSITIGDAAAGTGVVQIDSASFADPVTIAGGTIHDAAGLDIDAGINAVTLIGNVSPGQSPGILEVNGNFAFGGGSTFDVEILGAMPGSQHDQLAVVGTVDLNNTPLNIDDAGFAALGDEVFVLIDNDGADAVVGTFNGLPEGTHVTVGGEVFALSYMAGDGNDVALGRACSLNVTRTDDVGFETLRRAIECANDDAATDTVTFNIPGAGPHTIQTASALPIISNPIIIDGTSEPDFAGTPVIELDGTNAGARVSGLRLHAGNSTIRGLAINRFSSHGLLLAFGGGNTIAQNMIGTDPTGMTDVGNAAHGIVIFDSPNNIIGGTSSVDGNVISGNDLHGLNIVRAGSTGNLVQGNRIGVGADSMTPLGNGRIGVRIGLGASGNTIGGAANGAGNMIAHQTLDGVAVVDAASTQNAISRNSLFANGGLGIDLNDDGVTPNDATPGSEDADTGPNQLQNKPELGRAVVLGQNVTVAFRVRSAPAHSAYPLEIEMFLADATGQEGKTFLGAFTYSFAVGLLTRVVMFDATGKGVSVGSRIVATATDGAGNTSEFSVPITVSLSLAAQPFVDAASARWQQAGVAATALDTDAAGYDWSVNPTLMNDARPIIAPYSPVAAVQRMRLLSAVTHEREHVAGGADAIDGAFAEDSLFAWLEPGFRQQSLH